MDLIGRQDAIDLVRDVCDAILSECGCHYDSEVEDEVYDDIHEVSTILKCNKAIRKSLMDLPSAQPDVPDTNVGDTISRKAAIEAIDGALLDGLSEGTAIEILSELPSAQPISENDLIELQDRYGDEVRFVVEDMLSGEEKRWTTLSADRRRLKK